MDPVTVFYSCVIGICICILAGLAWLLKQF